MVPVFYTGLAFWALFMIAPFRALLGRVKRHRRPPAAVGLSYSRLMGGMRLGVGDVYSPIVPKTCSRKFKHRVAETFAQLAPAAFDSILNGEEIAAQLSLYGNQYTLPQILEEGVAPWTPTSNPHLRSSLNEAEVQRQRDEISAEQRVSFTGSIAAGIHETLNLLWRPYDPDHPEDIFRRCSGSHLGRVPVANQEAEESNLERRYDTEDDMPIRAVYGVRDQSNAESDNAFQPLGSGIH